MSRIGKKPIDIPAGVNVSIDGQVVSVKNGSTALQHTVHPDITAELNGNQILVTRPSDAKEHRSLHGLTRSLINNMVVGVSQGFSKNLEINGVWFQSQKQGNKNCPESRLFPSDRSGRTRWNHRRSTSPEPIDCQRRG